MPALLIFDVDGTLLQTERVTVPAVQRTFAAHGLPVPEEPVICSFFGKPVEDYEAWLAEQCPPGLAPVLVAETNALELRLIGDEGRLYDGVAETLARLRTDGHQLAVCSNGPDDYVDEFLDAHLLRPLFHTVRTRGTRYSGKIEMTAEILAELTARPGFFVGDRDDDVAAAHAHGLTAVAAVYGFGGHHELAGADLRLEQFADLPGLIAPRL